MQYTCHVHPPRFTILESSRNSSSAPVLQFYIPLHDAKIFGIIEKESLNNVCQATSHPSGIFAFSPTVNCQVHICGEVFELPSSLAEKRKAFFFFF